MPSYFPGSLQYGSPLNPGSIKKLTRIHDLRPVIDDVDGKTRCLIDGTSCPVRFRWFLDGSYPNAALFRKTLPHGTPVRVLPNIAGSMIASDPQLLGIGDYEFQIRQNGSASSGLIARTDVITVRSSQVEQPPLPVAVQVPQPDVDSTRTGATRGEFRVGESGAASYRIPIMTAASGGGLAPQLALAYDSHSGLGSAGLGWNLDGLSAISRCGKTTATDGIAGGVTLTSDDRFCLDGQRLIAINGAYGANGTEYRLEVDQIVRIRSYGNQGGGPTWFKVWRKDGTVSWYGSTEDGGNDLGHARVQSKLAGSQPPIWRWNVGRIEDSAGNYMRLTWIDRQSSGSGVETVLQSIAYGGNRRTGTTPYNTIDLVWQTLPNPAHRS